MWQVPIIVDCLGVANGTSGGVWSRDVSITTVTIVTIVTIVAIVTRVTKGH